MYLCMFVNLYACSVYVNIENGLNHHFPIVADTQYMNQQRSPNPVPGISVVMPYQILMLPNTNRFDDILMSASYWLFDYHC